jgi:hypothetical protein
MAKLYKYFCQLRRIMYPILVSEDERLALIFEWQIGDLSDFNTGEGGRLRSSWVNLWPNSSIIFVV